MIINKINIRYVIPLILMASAVSIAVISFSVSSIGLIRICLIIVITLALASVCASLYLAEKSVQSFSKYILNIIEKMMQGNNPVVETEQKETLESQVENRLSQLYETMQNPKEHFEIEHKRLQQLISDVSHQVKTPTAVLKSVNETLLRLQLPREEQISFLENAQTELEKLQFLMNFLIETSRLETGSITLSVEIAPLKQTIMNALNGVLQTIREKNIMISVECKQKYFALHDTKWTSEALFNILDNAAKYTPQNGKINIKVEEWGTFQKISVADTGCGVPYEIQPKIFQRFFRAENVSQKEGLGIGLYLARKIIMLQNGWIEVYSEGSNRGSIFSIYLPQS